MKNNKNKLYAIVLITATIVFIVAMVVRIFSMNFTPSSYKVSRMVSGNSENIKERLENLDDYIERHGPDVIYNELYYGHSYEPEFDDYWEFAQIQIDGVRGRFADDNTKYRDTINNYIANCDDEARKAAAESYLERMK